MTRLTIQSAALALAIAACDADSSRRAAVSEFSNVVFENVQVVRQP